MPEEGLRLPARMPQGSALNAAFDRAVAGSLAHGRPGSGASIRDHLGKRSRKSSRALHASPAVFAPSSRSQSAAGGRTCRAAAMAARTPDDPCLATITISADVSARPWPSENPSVAWPASLLAIGGRKQARWRPSPGATPKTQRRPIEKNRPIAIRRFTGLAPQQGRRPEPS